MAPIPSLQIPTQVSALHTPQAINRIDTARGHNNPASARTAEPLGSHIVISQSW